MNDLYKLANKEFTIVFEPNSHEDREKRRFGVGAGALHKYVGLENANKAIRDALNSSGDKFTRKLRNHGRIDFYPK